jgi:hypothetical protein
MELEAGRLNQLIAELQRENQILKHTLGKRAKGLNAF